MTEPQREVLSVAKRRGCWELKSLLSNFARDEFSVTLKIAVTIKIDVTEKLSRTRDLIADFSFSNIPSTAYGGPPPLAQGRLSIAELLFIPLT